MSSRFARKTDRSAEAKLELTQEQIGLALEIARRALVGERLEVYGVEDEQSENGRRLRTRPVDRGPIQEA